MYVYIAHKFNGILNFWNAISYKPFETCSLQALKKKKKCNKKTFKISYLYGQFIDYLCKENCKHMLVDIYVVH